MFRFTIRNPFACSCVCLLSLVGCQREEPPVNPVASLVIADLKPLGTAEKRSMVMG
jgi:hypothetical protein